MKETKDTVAAMHPQFWGVYEKREIYKDVLEGTLTLRDKRAKYLPKFPAETDADYDFRASTATCFNITAKTQAVMTGLVFKSDITLSQDVDEEIRLLWENIDNAGTHGDVFARRTLDAAFEGYSLILVDAPMVNATSREEQMRMGLRPYWILYSADQIWNWRYQINPVSKSKELSLIVLREISDEATGEFVSESVVRFRVFKFDGALVTWQLYREVEIADTSKTEYLLEAEGALPQLSQIPVAVVGELAADPPLLDIALKNIEHFQTYSDYKSLIHKTCVPIPVGKGVEIAGGDKIVVGGSTMVQTSPTGGFGFAEVSGSSLNITRQSLQDNRDEAALMGLSLLADKTAKVDLTATEALLNNIGETAELRVIARNLQDALELALGHTAEYLGYERVMGGSVELGAAWATEVDEYQMSLDELAQRAEIAMKLDGIMSKEWILRFLGVSNEEELQEIIRQIAEEDVVLVAPVPSELPPVEVDAEDVVDDESEEEYAVEEGS